MKKRVVKLNESELKDLIKESIKLTLDEESMNEYNLKDFGKDAAGVLGGAALTAGALAGNTYFSDDDPINPEQEEMNQAVEDEFGSVQGDLPSDTISWDEAMRLKKENRHMNKKLIRLTEGDLHRIVKESVERILAENDFEEGVLDPILRHIPGTKACKRYDRRAKINRQVNDWNDYKKGFKSRSQILDPEEYLSTDQLRKMYNSAGA